MSASKFESGCFRNTRLTKCKNSTLNISTSGARSCWTDSHESMQQMQIWIRMQSIQPQEKTEKWHSRIKRLRMSNKICLHLHLLLFCNEIHTLRTHARQKYNFFSTMCQKNVKLLRKTRIYSVRLWSRTDCWKECYTRFVRRTEFRKNT